MTEHHGAAVYDHLEDDPRQSEIVLRRIARFFEAGGICDAYERRGDQPVQFYDIANLMADTVPALSRDAVIRRFLFSAKTGWFGRHGPRQTIEQLIDLDNFPPRGRYSLRPSYLRVEASPEYMRAPRSVWARWLKALGWPVPPELEFERSGTGSPLPPAALVPAGYDPAWISFDEGVRRVMRAAACDQREAIMGIVAACKDGAVASQYGNTHDAIEPVSWGCATIRKGYRAEARGYLLIAIVPRPGEIPLPREMPGPTSPDDGVPRVDRAWSYAPVELRREDLERLWQSPPALEEPRGLLKHAAAGLEASGTEERLAQKELRSAIERTISALGRPGNEVRWKVFCDAVRSEGKATGMRPYTDRHIRRVLTAIEADRTKIN